MPAFDFQPLPLPPSQLGESPFWHPDEQALYWCDIAGRAVHRYVPSDGAHASWPTPSEPSCAAPRPDGGLVVAMRDGIFHLDTRTGERERIVRAPYDPAHERFNDGKADPQGRFWVGTIQEQRAPLAALYCLTLDSLDRVFDGATNSNGLAFSPDGATMYWSDTRLHTVFAFDFDPDAGDLSRRRVHARFEPRREGQPLEDYGGRPDGGAVDAEGCYWAAMYEGQRLVRLAPDGRELLSVPLPVRCPTMPCFGGPDLRTLYVTTTRDHRPEDELARQPWAGCVLQCAVDVPGLPVNFADV